MDLQKEFEARFKVRVDIPDTDTRNYLCGSKRLNDERGQYFIIPASLKDYTSKILPQYVFGEAYEEQDEQPKRGRKPKVDE